MKALQEKLDFLHNVPNLRDMDHGALRNLSLVGRCRLTLWNPR